MNSRSKGAKRGRGAKQDLNEKRKVDAPEIMNGLERYAVSAQYIEWERNNFKINNMCETKINGLNT